MRVKPETRFHMQGMRCSGSPGYLSRPVDMPFVQLFHARDLSWYFFSRYSSKLKKWKSTRSGSDYEFSASSDSLSQSIVARRFFGLQ